MSKATALGFTHHLRFGKSSLTSGYSDHAVDRSNKHGQRSPASENSSILEFFQRSYEEEVHTREVSDLSPPKRRYLPVATGMILEPVTRPSATSVTSTAVPVGTCSCFSLRLACFFALLAVRCVREQRQRLLVTRYEGQRAQEGVASGGKALGAWIEACSRG